MTPEELPTVFAAFITRIEGKRLLVISRSERPLTPEQYLPAGASLEWLSDVQLADDMRAIDRVDLSVVFDQLEHMKKTEGVHLLSRLRDHYCNRVLLHCTDQVYSNRELLALGFIEQKRPSSSGSFFLFDPDIFFEQRDWNTPDKWAHPENFKKIRW